MNRIEILLNYLESNMPDIAEDTDSSLGDLENSLQYLREMVHDREIFDRMMSGREIGKKE